MGADAADGNTGGAVRADRGPLPARTKPTSVQVVERVLKRLMGATHADSPPPPKPTYPGRARPVAGRHDPVQAHRFGGFAHRVGGVTSHTAIVARSLNIPAVVGAASRAPPDPRDDLVIVDGATRARGESRIRPSWREYRLSRRSATSSGRSSSASSQARRHARRHAGASCSPISSCPRTSTRRWTSGAHGRGPVPHRVPVPESPRLPDEDEQFQVYRDVAARHERSPGHDPHARPGRRQGDGRAGRPARRAQSCAGPARASASASPSRRCSTRSCARSCAPRATAASASWCRCWPPRSEIVAVARMVEQAKAATARQGVAFDEPFDVGGMIEVPAAALALDRSCGGSISCRSAPTT